MDVDPTSGVLPNPPVVDIDVEVEQVRPGDTRTARIGAWWVERWLKRSGLVQKKWSMTLPLSGDGRLRLMSRVLADVFSTPSLTQKHKIQRTPSQPRPEPSLPSLDLHYGRAAMVFFALSMTGEKLTGLSIAEQVEGCARTLTGGG